ncbi:MAG: hypothetical protein RL477_1041 [Pseudomonadota bacterium]|jgi:LmbE family N-acetylglucosaminyl deacetylase
MATVLVVAPHGMDEVLGCGGTIARHAAAGDRVETLVLFGQGQGLDAGRRTAAPAAAAILGSQAPVFAGFPENRADTVALVDVIAAVEKAIADQRPDTLYVSHGGNLNIDHRIAFQAAVTAARPVPGHPVDRIYAYEVVSSTEWAPPQIGAPFLPSRFVDIGAFEARKFEALACYGAELREAPHARSIEGIRAQLRRHGHSVGYPAAEAFVVIRERLGGP